MFHGRNIMPFRQAKDVCALVILTLSAAGCGSSDSDIKTDSNVTNSAYPNLSAPQAPSDKHISATANIDRHQITHTSKVHSYSNLENENCSALWKNFIPLEAPRLDYSLCKKLQHKLRFRPEKYYSEPIDFDNDGDKEIILVTDEIPPLVIGGPGSVMTIIKAKSLGPTVAVEDYLSTAEFDEESIFFSDMRTKNWPVDLVTKDIDLPELDSGRFEFGTIYNQIVIKINADEYLTQPPKEARPHLISKIIKNHILLKEKNDVTKHKHQLSKWGLYKHSKL